jgi:hypothetical protein
VDVHDGADRLDQVREEEGKDEDIGGRAEARIRAGEPDVSDGVALCAGKRFK